MKTCSQEDLTSSCHREHHYTTAFSNPALVLGDWELGGTECVWGDTAQFRVFKWNGLRENWEYGIYLSASLSGRCEHVDS